MHSLGFQGFDPTISHDACRRRRVQSAGCGDFVDLLDVLKLLVFEPWTPPEEWITD